VIDVTDFANPFSVGKFATQGIGMTLALRFVGVETQSIDPAEGP
jgi:hypothetical protein